MRKKIFRYVYPIVALLFLLSLVAVSGVLARYSTTVQSNQAMATPEAFYFECNFEQDGLYLFPADRDFTFVVKNHDPFERVSASDVTFGVTLDGKEIVSGQVLDKNQVSSQEVSLSKQDLNLGETHKVVITSTAPFEKTISFEIFVVEDKVASFYTLEHHKNWVQLDLYIGSDVPETLTLDYSGFAPDNTHPLMQTWKTDEGTKTLTAQDLHPYTQYTLIFFGTEQINAVDNKTALPASITIKKQ